MTGVAGNEAIKSLNKKNAPQNVIIGNSIIHFWAGEPASPQSKRR